jgi:hypothetical protein
MQEPAAGEDVTPDLPDCGYRSNILHQTGICPQQERKNQAQVEAGTSGSRVNSSQPANSATMPI